MDNYNQGNHHPKLRLTKQVVVDSLKSYLGIPNAETVFYDDRKPSTRHCCLGEPGIKHLSVMQWQFIDESGKIIIVEYFMCPSCHKLLVFRDFM